MKKLCLVIVLLAVITINVNAQNPPRRGNNGKNVSLVYDYRVAVGDTTYYSGDKTDGLLTGASDSLYTRWYDFMGDISIQVEAYGGTTANYYIVIQTANLGNETSDSLNFADAAWLAWTGAGLDNAAMKTTSTMSDQQGCSIPMLVARLAANKFRVLVYSAATQSGNTTVVLKAMLKGE